MVSFLNRKLRKPTPKTPQTCHHQKEGIEKSEPGRASNLVEDGDRQHDEVASAQRLAGCQQCKTEKKAAKSYRWKIIGGLLMPFMLASLDLTIVSTALPSIANYFDRLNQLNWIVTAFTLTSTCFIPAAGQLADVFGRYAVLQSAMVLVIVGSILGAAAQNWPMVLLGRGLQGLASAGIQNVIKIVLADSVNLKENATNNTLFSLISGLSFAIGPVVGGYLTAVSWRWCFIINIPIALLAMVAMFFLLRKELVGPAKLRDGAQNKRFFAQLAVLDYGGIFLFLFGAGLIILATTWGGSTYPWPSVNVLVPLIIGVVLFVSFFLYEYLLEPGNFMARTLPSVKAMIPLRLFYKKDMALVAFINFAAGAAIYSVFYFIGLYFTLVQDYSPGKSGLQLLFYIPGIGVGVYLAMFLCNIFPKHTFTPLLFGSFIEALGIGLIIYAISIGNIPLVNGMMALAGAGTGLRFMPATLHITGMWPSQIAPAMSLVDFCLPFGGTVALAMMGSVFSNKLAGVVPGFSPSAGRGSSGGGSNSPSLADLPPQVQDSIHAAVRQAVIWSFVSIVPILGLAVVAGLILGNVSISAREKRTSEGHLDTAQDVVEEPYLLYLARGRKRRTKGAAGDFEEP